MIKYILIHITYILIYTVYKTNTNIINNKFYLILILLFIIYTRILFNSY